MNAVYGALSDQYKLRLPETMVALSARPSQETYSLSSECLSSRVPVSCFLINLPPHTEGQQCRYVDIAASFNDVIVDGNPDDLESVAY
jgi:hypothetical protein